MNNRYAGHVLAELVGAPDMAENINDRLESLGGIHGLFLAGADALESLLTGHQLEQVRSLITLMEVWTKTSVFPDVVDSPNALAKAFRRRLAFEPAESFWVVSLDIRRRILCMEQVALGTLTTCLVHPREVFAPALRVRAASIIVVHNHPSGDPSPSLDDMRLTARLRQAGTLLGIPLLEHLVVAKEGFCLVPAKE